MFPLCVRVGEVSLHCFLTDRICEPWLTFWKQNSFMSDPVVLLHKPNRTMSENWEKKKGISKKSSFPKRFLPLLISVALF